MKRRNVIKIMTGLTLISYDLQAKVKWIDGVQKFVDLRKIVNEADFFLESEDKLILALRYAPEKEDFAPVIIYKGKITSHIRHLAKVYKTPIIPKANLPLNFYTEHNCGDYISCNSYVDIAEIYASVYSLKEK